jgi:hypothetical protein
MHTFAEKVEATQQTTSTKSTILSRCHSEQSPEMGSILHLQRTLGNQAVQQTVQTNSGQPKAELTGPASPRFGHDFSRISIHPPAAGAIQTTLAINEPGDRYEQDADRTAEHVMRAPEPRLQLAWPRGGGAPPGHPAQPGREPESVQTTRVQAGDTGPVAAPPIVHDVVRSPGQPLDPATRAFMEPRFGYDFSQVRVHTGATAEQSAQDVNAHAFTVGYDMVLGAGRYAPATNEGRRLLAHELTHVVQAGSTASNPALQPSSVETLEREARRVAETVGSADTVPPIRGSARGLMVPLRQGPNDPDKATFGNLPGDIPWRDSDKSLPLGRVVLSQEGGVWYEERLGGKKFRAEGTYDFVVQKGKIWAVRVRRSVPMGRPNPGHTEAAAGGRVEYAGTVSFGTTQAKRGEVLEWSNSTGHYAPVSDEKFAKAAGLPLDNRFKPVTGVRPEWGGPQSPVYQPQTRSRGGEPPKVPPGPPRLGELEAHLRGGKPKLEPPTEAKALGTEAKLLQGEGATLEAARDLAKPGRAGRAARIGALLLELGLPGPWDVLFLFLDAFGSIAEAKAKLKADAFATGFGQGLAAVLTGTSWSETARLLMFGVGTPSEGERVAGFEGVRERGTKEGVAAGFKFGQALDAEERQGFRNKCFAGIASRSWQANWGVTQEQIQTASDRFKGKAPGFGAAAADEELAREFPALAKGRASAAAAAAPPRQAAELSSDFGRDDLIKMGTALRPTVIELLEEAERQREQRDREEARRAFALGSRDWIGTKM